MRNPGSQSDTFTAVDIVPVTPSDTVDLAQPARAIRAQGAGNIRILTFMDTIRTTPIAAGETLPVFVRRVYADGTTATGIEALI